MLRLWTTRQPAVQSREWYEQVFLDHYERIVTWAVQLAGGRTQAEDLVQDAFVYLVNARPNLSEARTIDAYLYGILRNLHRAQLNRSVRRQGISLSILDFDCLEQELSVLDAATFLSVQHN